MTALIIIGIVAFVVFALWVMHDEHFADPKPRPSQLRRRQLDELVAHDEVSP